MHGTIIRLAANNFTPLTRTPWAGKEIARSYKNEILSDATVPIGESWEVSCDPTFPSYCSDLNCTLQQLIDQNPPAILGEKLGRYSQPTCEILIKLLNAAAPLSLQIHPDDDDPDLLPNECGKPESWYILQAEPGAGIYLGFKEKISHAQIKSALRGDSAKDILQFVPVQPGDYFEIAPGVPHAIGAGVTLLEPQRIIRGKSGKTFRLWDWGRRYNANGHEDPTGKPRPLHLDEALKLIDIEVCYGAGFIERLRRTPEITKLGQGQRKQFPANPYYGLDIYDSRNGSEFPWPEIRSFFIVLPLSCSVKIADTIYPKGQPLFIPANVAATSAIQTLKGGELAVVYPVTPRA